MNIARDEHAMVTESRSSTTIKFEQHAVHMQSFTE